MFDEDSMEVAMLQTPQPKAVPGNILPQTSHPDLTAPMNMPQMPTPQPEPELVIPANMPQVPKTSITPRAALANILANMSQSHQHSVTPTKQPAEHEVESPPVVLEQTMTQWFLGLPLHKPIDV